MVQMNRPENQRNQYSDISMAPPAAAQKKQATLQDSLNKISGNKVQSVEYVDRKSKENLGQDGFLKLLAAQLKNQDPMKPMDQKDFSANLAQFSQLEQLQAMNKKLEAVSQNAIDDKRVQGASFLGKNVITSGTSLDYAGGGDTIGLPFHLEKPAIYAVINVVDDKNQLIARIEKEGLGRGMQEIAWDGLTVDGQYAAKGSYRFEVIAFDQNQEKFLGDTKASGTVQSVSFDNGETVLSLTNGRKVFLKDVQNFSLSQQESAGKNIHALQKNAQEAYNKIENQ